MILELREASTVVGLTIMGFVKMDSIKEDCSSLDSFVVVVISS